MVRADNLPKVLLPSSIDPATPVDAVFQRAATAPDVAYKPTDALLKLAAVLFEANAPTWTELAKLAGISRTQLWRLTNDPAACAWLVAHGTKAAETGLGAVHARLLQLALTSKSPAAIELYLKRFDPEYQKRTQTGGDTNINSEFAAVVSMSPSELESFIRLKRKSGGHDAVPAPSRE